MYPPRSLDVEFPISADVGEVVGIVAEYSPDGEWSLPRRVKTRTFQEGDLVLRLIQDKKGMHKLSPPWEGPFAIGRVLGNDAYYLIDVRGDGKLDVKRPWNVNLLRKFYS